MELSAHVMILIFVWFGFLSRLRRVKRNVGFVIGGFFEIFEMGLDFVWFGLFLSRLWRLKRAWSARSATWGL